MPIPKKVLAAIQSAGTAVYAADKELKAAVIAYAEQVRDAMHDNPFNVGNDGLFEEWKSVARISQAMTQVEAELRSIHAATQVLGSNAMALPSAVTQLSAPAILDSMREVDATDVKPKRRGKPAKAKKAATAKAKAPRKPRLGIPENATRVLAVVTTSLNADAFVKVNWSDVATKSGLPKGSVGASVAKLKSLGMLIEGDKGHFKLGTAPTSA